MTASPTLLLTRSDVRALLDPDSCLAAVESAFRAHAEGAVLPAGVIGAAAEGGGFHIKTAGLSAGRGCYAVKANANFPGNPARHGLPTVQGVIALFDATDGRLLALLDSMEVTALRTAAATALATKYLARGDARVLTLLGCGTQGRSHVRALSRVRRLERIFAWDMNAEAADALARDLGGEIAVPITPVADYRPTLAGSDIVVSCTPSRRALLTAVDIAPGTFVAGVGADSEDKHELAPDLMARAAVVVDVLEQCVKFGDLHHAIVAGAMRREDVHAELADVVSGRRPAGNPERDVTVFDSTGTALEDVAAAAAVFEGAVNQGRGSWIRLGG